VATRRVELFLRGDEKLYRRLRLEDLDTDGNVDPTSLSLHVSFGRDQYDPGGLDLLRKSFTGLATITIEDARALGNAKIQADVIDSPSNGNQAHAMIVFLPRDHADSDLETAELELKVQVAAKMKVVRQPTK